MKKLLLALNILFLSNTVFLNSSFAETKTVAVQQVTQTDKQHLIDDWVDYKIITFQIAEKVVEPEKIAQLMDQSAKDDVSFAKTMFNHAKEYTDAYKQRLNALKPRTTEMKKLIQLQIKNVDSTLSLMLAHDLQKDETGQKKFEAEFIKASNITKQTQELESEIEFKALQYLIDLRGQVQK